LAERTVTSRHIHRYRAWKKNILSYIWISFVGVGLFLALFLVAAFAPLNLAPETVSLLSTVTAIGLGIFALALLLCLLILGIISRYGDRMERGSIGHFLTNPEVPYDEKRRSLGVITGSGYLPATPEEQIWYNLVMQHWPDLYMHGPRILPPLARMLGSARLSSDREGMVVVEHLADLVRFTGEEGITAMLACLEGENERACANAALILAELHEKRAIPLLLPRIRGEIGGSSDLLQSLVAALGRYQDRSTVQPLLHLVDSSNTTLQKAALASLRAQGDAVLRAAWQEEEDPAQKTRLRIILESLL
jgi:hypothetical protein